MTPFPSRPRSKRAFTLTEVMLSMGVFTLLAAMVLTLVVGVTRSLFDSQNKGQIDRDFRMTTSKLSQLVGSSDFICVMDSIQSKKDLTMNQGGDLFVAVYYQNPGAVTAKGTFDTTVARVAGFCRLPDSDGKAEGGPIYYFDSGPIDSGHESSWGMKFPQDSLGTAKSIATLLPDAKNLGAFTKLADCAYSTDASGKIFIANDTGTGALMLARIRNGMPGRYVSNTYAFSVSSRNL